MITDHNKLKTEIIYQTRYYLPLQKLIIENTLKIKTNRNLVLDCKLIICDDLNLCL